MSKSTVSILYDQILDLNTNVKEVVQSCAIMSIQVIDHKLDVLFQKEVDQLDMLAQQQEQIMHNMVLKMKAINHLINNYDNQRIPAKKV